MQWRKPLAAATALAVTATFFVGGVAQAATVAPLELSIVADGAVPFDADDAPGNDSSATNGIVRTHDTVQYKWSWEASSLDPAVFEQVLPEGMVWTEQAKSSCNNAADAISADGRTLSCEITPGVVGNNTYQPTAKVQGIANGLELKSTVSSGAVTSNEVAVTTSAAPKWNISTLIAHPFPSYFGSDYGVTFQNNSYIWAPVDPQKGVRGIEPLDTYSFKLDPNLGDNTVPVNCGVGSDVANITCDQPAPGGQITVTVTDAAASTALNDYSETIPGMSVANTVNHWLFTPATDYDAAPIADRATLVSEFDPDSVSGQSNFGSGYALHQEPGAAAFQITGSRSSWNSPDLDQGPNSVKMLELNPTLNPLVYSPYGMSTQWRPDTDNKVPADVEEVGPEMWTPGNDRIDLDPDQRVTAKNYIANKDYAGKPFKNVTVCYRLDPDFIRVDALGGAPFAFKSPLTTVSSDSFSYGGRGLTAPGNTLDPVNATVEYGTVAYPGKKTDCGSDTDWHGSIADAGGSHKVTSVRIKVADDIVASQALYTAIPLIRVRNVDPGTESRMFIDYRYDYEGTTEKGTSTGRFMKAVGVAVTPELSVSEAASAPGEEIVWQAKATPNTTQGYLPDLTYRVQLPACVAYVNGSASLPNVQVTPADNGADGQPCTGDDVSGEVLSVTLGQTRITELPQFTFRTKTLTGSAATAGAPLAGTLVLSSTADPRDEALRTTTATSTVSALSAAADSDGDGVSDAREQQYGSDPNHADQWPKTVRVAGNDRFATAVEVSKRTATTGDTVLIARGDKYPDALVGGPAAAKAGGVLLLTMPKTLPGNVRAELARIQPSKIIVLGGTGAVSAGVEQVLRNYSSDVSRVSGSDRFDTAAKIADRFFGSSDKAMLATGTNFPDALALASVATIGDPVPVLLTPKNSLPAGTRSVINNLGVNKVVIGGGASVVSAAIENSLTADSIAVTRYWGADRYATAAAIAAAYAPAGAPAMYAAGTDFPDALVAANMAHKYQTPLLLTPKSCSTSSVASVASGLGAYYRYLVGGTGVLRDSVMTTVCP